ncbi:MAG: dipeptidyl peptidase 3 [Bacteroidales bacterium OttesenSCG-928-I14]|nr:dipeptidyl peptidase 3 [Bacteroidales bacterium OttesenSCG-928-I14]
MNHIVECFDNVSILRYVVEKWESLSINQKKLIYCLNEAALHGRDIVFDQNNSYNLAIRRSLEAIYSKYVGDKTDENYKAFLIYIKKIWFFNGIHNNYSGNKILPDFSKDFFMKNVKSLSSSVVPVRDGQSLDDFLMEIIPVMYDPHIYAKKINQDSNCDVILASANNYYGRNVTQADVEQFYNTKKKSIGTTSILHGLNSRLVKKNGILIEEVYKIGGLYSAAIEQIVHWLIEASKYVENKQQKNVIDFLIKYYKTGCLKTYDEYAIQWIHDTLSKIDFINGFTESYGDSLGIKASWESIVNFEDFEKTKMVKLISDNAQWFEDNSPIDSKFKKKKVKGVTSKVVIATILGGDCYPSSPLGINLPNSNWIRENYGSKSITISNISNAYSKMFFTSGFIDEFVYGCKEKKMIKKYGFRTGNLHTILHECLGHASGSSLIKNTNALGCYSASIEEARADLFSLYYMFDAKILELGLLSDHNAYKAEYYKFLMNGIITQLACIKLGGKMEESHMINRALISNYILEIGHNENVAGIIKKSGKTYIVINDYKKMHDLISQLLIEIQRIKSEGDFNKAKYLVENYAVCIDTDLHKEVLERYNHLNITPYKGFVNPVYKPIKNMQGDIVDVKISYNENYAEQMLRYSQNYSHLPTYN